MLNLQRAGRMLLGASVGIVGAMALAANRGGNSRPPALDAPPGRTESATPKPARDMTVRFQFDGVPYTEVVRQFAQAAGKPLIGDLNIDGTLTFFDSDPSARSSPAPASSADSKRPTKRTFAPARSSPSWSP